MQTEISKTVCASLFPAMLNRLDGTTWKSLAEHLEVDIVQISQWRHGRPCSLTRLDGLVETWNRKAEPGQEKCSISLRGGSFEILWRS